MAAEERVERANVWTSRILSTYKRDREEQIVMEEGGEEEGHRTISKKENRYASETEPGREGRIKTNRSCMRTCCCLSGRVMEKIIE